MTKFDFTESKSFGGYSPKYMVNIIIIDGWLRMGLLTPPREFCRHILSCRELKAESFKRCLHSGSGALVCKSLKHTLLNQTKKK